MKSENKFLCLPGDITLLDGMTMHVYLTPCNKSTIDAAVVSAYQTVVDASFLHGELVVYETEE